MQQLRSRKRPLPVESDQRPDNPAYIALTSQLESARREMAHLLRSRKTFARNNAPMTRDSCQMPEIEREYHDLTRDYDNAQTRYREVKAKQMQTEVAQALEKDRKAERFSLGEPTTIT